MMTFPFTPTGLRVALDLDGSGEFAEDITPYVMTPSGVSVTISEGLRSEGATSDSSQMTMSLNNADGRFSTRNPDGPYAGLLVRNTAVRASLDLDADGIHVDTHATSDAALTDKSPEMSFTGDMEVQVDVDMSSWRSLCSIIHRWGESGDYGWYLAVEDSGTIVLVFSHSGSNLYANRSDTAVPISSGRLSIRCVFDRDNGAGGRTAKFYTSTSGLGGPWTQLGGDSIGVSSVTMYDSTAGIGLGDISYCSGRSAAKVYAAKVWDGWEGAGTLVADLDMSSDDVGNSGGTVTFAGTSCRSVAGANPSGDNDVRVSAQLNDWTPASDNAIVGKYVNAGNQRSWALYIPSTGRPTLYLSTDGSSYTGVSATAATGFTDGSLHYLRWTRAQATGVVKFYTSTSGSAWTQLGADVASGVTGALYASSGMYQIGARSGTSVTSPMSGIVGKVRVLDGIDGDDLVPISPVDWTDGYDGSGTGSVVSSQPSSAVIDSRGNGWVLTAPAERVTRKPLFTGRVPSWSPRPGLVGDDNTLDVVAYDVVRKLSKDGVLLSPYVRACSAPDSGMVDVRAYWPMTDAQGSTQYASGLSGGQAAYLNGAPQLASDSSSFVASDPLPVFASGASIAGGVPSYPDGHAQATVLLRLPPGWSTTARVLSIVTTGSIAKWDVYVNATGAFQVIAYDSSGSSVMTSGYAAMGMTLGDAGRPYLAMQQNGSGVDWWLSWIKVGATSGGYISGNIASNTLGRARWVSGAPDGNLVDCTLGSLLVQGTVTSVFDQYVALAGFSGESPAARIMRVCREQGVQAEVIGGGGLTLGPQRSGTLLDTLRSVETTDDGVLTSNRQTGQINYISSLAMSDAPVIDTSYLASGLLPPTPTDDDQQLRNDITVSRDGGSSVRISLDSGPLSTLDPPDGSGRYAPSPIVTQVLDDSQLSDRASWELSQGTVDEPRYPSLTFDLGANPYATDQAGACDAQRAALEDLRVGQRVRLSDMSVGWNGSTELDQVAIGITRRVGPWVHELDIVARPASPYQIVRLDSGALWGSSDSTVDGAHAAGATTLSVALGSIYSMWGDGSAPFVITVASRQMTVTAVSGTSSPQTFTVPAGLPADLSGGERVDVAYPVRWPM